MKRKGIRMLGFALVALAVLAGRTTPSAAPVDDVEAMPARIGSLAAHHTDFGWIPISDAVRTIDLKTLSEGLPAVLGLVNLPVGEYNELRFSVLDATIIVKGQVYPLNVPSGVESGIKIHGSFCVSAAGVHIVLDWDPRRSVRHNRARGYWLVPSISMTGSATCGCAITVDAGPDRSATFSGDRVAVFLDATVSNPTGCPLAYEWSVVNAPLRGAVDFDPPDGEDTTATLKFSPGAYDLKLAVSTAEGTVEDTLTINASFPRGQITLDPAIGPRRTIDGATVVSVTGEGWQADQPVELTWPAPVPGMGFVVLGSTITDANGRIGFTTPVTFTVPSFAPAGTTVLEVQQDFFSAQPTFTIPFRVTPDVTSTVAVCQEPLVFSGSGCTSQETVAISFGGEGVVRSAVCSGNSFNTSADPYTIRAELAAGPIPIAASGDRGFSGSDVLELVGDCSPRIVPTVSTIGRFFILTDPQGRMVGGSVVVFTPVGQPSESGARVIDAIFSQDGKTVMGVVPPTAESGLNVVTVHQTSQSDPPLFNGIPFEVR